MRSIVASLALVAALIPNPASAEDANVTKMAASFLNVRELSRALDDDTEIALVKELHRAMTEANRLLEENKSLLQQLVNYRVAEIRANGECIQAQAFDAAPSGLPADLRCPD